MIPKLLEKQVDSSSIENSSQLDQFANRLGFTESSDMTELRTLISSQIKSGGDYVANWIRYKSQAESLADQVDPDSVGRVRVGIMIMKAFIYLSGNKPEWCEDELFEALDVANQYGLIDVREAIRSIDLSMCVAQSARSKIGSL